MGCCAHNANVNNDNPPAEQLQVQQIEPAKPSQQYHLPTIIESLVKDLEGKKALIEVLNADLENIEKIINKLREIE